MPRRFIRSIEPIVSHGLRELREGAPTAHVLREVTLMGAMLGTGLSPREAIARVERFEPELIGMGRWEAWEREFHPRLRGRGATSPWGGAVPAYGYASPAGYQGMARYTP